MKSPEINQLVAALEALPVGIVLCDAQGRLVWVSQKARYWLALPEADTLASSKVQDMLPGLPWPLASKTWRVRGAAGQLLAVQVCPLAGVGDFVVQLQPVATQPGDWQPLLLQQFLEGLRRPVANIRAAIETLTAYPNMAPDLAAQFQHILLEQTEALAQLLGKTVSAYTRYLQAHWPLEQMPVADLLQLMASALEQASLRMQIVTGQLAAIVQADRCLWTRFWEQLGRQLCQVVQSKDCCLSATFDRGLVWIELRWQGRRLSPERLQRWLTQTLFLDEQGLSLTFLEVLAWHEADLWAQHDSQGPQLRLVLPALSA